MALPEAGVQLVAEGLSQFLSGMGKADDAVEKFGKSGGDAGKDFDKGFGDVVTGALRKVGELGVEALVSAGQAVAGFVKNSIGLAGDFQSGMLEFQAVAGKSVDTAGLQEFHDLFLQIGKDLPVSTSDVQQAAIEMVKGGIDPATIAAGGLESSIKFAAAAMDGDLAGAANISAKVVGGWAEVNATAAEKAALLTTSQDLLTKAANASTVGVEDLSLGLFNVQGNAKLAGISLDETVTTLALLSPNFSSAATAGTSFNNFIARLQPTTAPAIDAMTTLGLYTEETGSVFYDAQGNFVGMAQASQLLKDATKDLTDAQQQSILQTIFGNDAMGTAAELSRQGADGYNQMVESLSNANGVLENAALKQDGFNTSMDNAMGSIEAVQIQLGEKLLPILGDLLDNVVTPAINAFGDFAEAVFGSDKAFEKLSPELQAIVTVIDDVVRGFGDDGLTGALDALIPGMGDVIKSFQSGGAAADNLSGVLDDLGVVWDKVLNIAQAVADGYMAIAQAILPVVTKFWEEHGAEITAFLKTAYDTVMSIINTALDLYMAIVPPILHAIAGFISEHGDTIIAALKGAWDIISGVIDGALAIIQGVLKTALALIQGDWEGAWKAVQEMTDRVIQDVIKIFTGAVDLFRNSAQLTLDAVLEVWNNFRDWAGIGDDVIQGIIDGIKGGVGALIDAVTQAASDALEAAKDFLGISSPSKLMAEAVGEPIVGGIAAGIESALPSLLGVVDSMSIELIGKFKKMNEDLADEIEKASASFRQQIAKAQDALADLQISGLSSTANINRQKLSNLDALDKLSDKSKAAAQLQLESAERQASMIADPKQQAEFFRARSKQIFELGELTDQINAATDKKERERLVERYQLVNAAQLAESKALSLQQSQGSQTTSAMDLLSALLTGSISAGGKSVGLPGIFDSPLIAQLTSLFGQLRDAPATMAQMYAAQGSTYSSTTNYNMPVYTNQSASVVQDSFAIAQATLP